jgi:oligopeptide transport system ATP-binding protein
MEPLLEIHDLHTHFHTRDGVVKSVNGVSFSVRRGETLGIVGESGSGKSVTSLSIMRLVPSPPGTIAAGRILFAGTNLLDLSEARMRQVRGNRLAMIFQDPMTSLNPVLTVGRQITELLELHLHLSRKEARTRAVELLTMVGIPGAARRLGDYPHQFSGGMRQRVMIAMALSCNPELLIADEPTTALDVTIQAQILELINNLKEHLHTAVILITHDLGVVAGMTDRMLVMYAGRVVEEGKTSDIFANPRMPYTIGLLRSIPRLDEEQGHTLSPIRGLPPDLIDLPQVCPFSARCDYVQEACMQQVPPLRTVGDDHKAACLFDITLQTPVPQRDTESTDQKPPLVPNA